MEFNKRELRNNRNPLLSRIQRQMDVSNERKQSEYEKLLYAPKPIKKFDKFGAMELDGYSEPEQTLIAPVRKQTRLSLMRQRGGRN